MESKNELTSTLHLSKQGSAHSPSGLIDEYLASLAPDDLEVISQVLATAGASAMVLISTGIQKGARFLLTDIASIGRSASSSIFLDDITVSRSHARIEKSQETLPQFSFALENDVILDWLVLLNVMRIPH